MIANKSQLELIIHLVRDNVGIVLGQLLNPLHSPSASHHLKNNSFNYFSHSTRIKYCSM